MRKFLLLITLAVSAVNAIAAEYWEQVTSMDQLKSGDVVALASTSTYNKLGTSYQDKNNYIDVVDYTFADGELSAAPYELTFIANGDKWNVKNADGKYLCYTGSKNTVNLQASAFDLSVTVTTTGIIKITTGSRVLQYNSSSPRLAFYTGTQMDIIAYRKVNDTQTGIDGIAVDGNAKAEYFTLQGTRVEGDTLAPGFYVRRQGGKTAKIMVR